MRGFTHAITAGAAAAAIATYGWHQAPALAATTAVIALGAGTEPDVDQPGSCIARAWARQIPFRQRCTGSIVGHEQKWRFRFGTGGSTGVRRSFWRCRSS